MVAPAFHTARKLVYSVSGHAADLTIVGRTLSRRFRAREAIEMDRRQATGDLRRSHARPLKKES